MGLFSGSKKTSNTTNLNESNASNLDNRIFEGDVGIAEGNVSISGSGNTIMRTDHGALATANQAFQSLVDINKSNNELSLTTAELSLDAATNFASRSFDLAESSTENSLDFAGKTFTQMTALIERDASASRQQSANEISKAYDLAATHSRSEGAEAMDKSVKVLMWGGLGLGLAFISVQYFKSN